ncbi:TetR/AcrR family transcriptional regulator [Blastococcus sp. BMG 814]|uniref:TetR/AcrR family transcriptional regulator n=1 Tax=Blastococcus carthaginiensis TaxID=3050034 RepID=A0ABT9I8W1_9ACTN|nr:TetR/AcrR family transcriptional regulator [Blastococcus carthaginiensis]MDP5182016.1 TetR/AcrR family transcriptional regulator [Blastococcus carthaginiensis]
MARPSVEEERKAQILASACRVIAERGITEMRVADVARDAGLSAGIIHYYFDNKRELIKAAFAANFSDSLKRRSGVLEGAGTAREKLRSLIDSYLPEGDATVRAWHVWVELWADALQDTDLQKLNELAYGEWRRIVGDIVAEGQRAGDFTDGDPLVLADVVVATLDGISIQGLLGSSGMSMDHMRLVCSELVDRLLVR